MKKIILTSVILALTLSCADDELKIESSKQQMLEGSLNFILTHIPIDYRVEVSEKISKSYQRDFGFDVEPDPNLLGSSKILQAAKTPPVPSGGGGETSRCYWSYLTAEIVHTEIVDHYDGTTGMVYIFDDGCSQIIWYDGEPDYIGPYQTGYDASCYCD